MLKLILAFALAISAHAQLFGKPEPVLKDRSGLALKGYDPVAYFTEGKPIQGKPEIQHTHSNVKYNFASTANLELFKKDPNKYLPQYGGYCAWAVGHNYTASTDPEAWKIVNGKLYLNYSKDVQRKWMAEEANLIKSGDANWPNLHK